MLYRVANLAFLLALVCSAAFAGPLVMPQPPTSPLDNLEVLHGPIEAQTEGALVTLNLGDREAAKYRIFRVETDSSLSGSPIAFRADASEIYFWNGHLVVLVPSQGQGWHFSVPGIDELMKGRPGLRPSTEDREALLAGYDVTRIVASGIASFSGPKALRPERPAGLGSAPLMNYQPENPDPGTGVGTCGSNCSITCRDSSSCVISCGVNRCATCTCPLSCSCS